MNADIPSHIAEGPPLEQYGSDKPWDQLKTKRLSTFDLDLIRNSKGVPKPLLANVITLLTAEKAFFNLRYDDFSYRVFRGEAQLADEDFIDITNWVQRAGIEAAVNTVADAVKHVAMQCRFHRVTEYLRGLEWDHVPRLDTMLIEHGGAADTEINRAMTGKYFIQAVARVMKPACQADSMLILEGTQGLKKSGLFAAMSKPFFVDHISNFGNKDAKQELRGVWIIEIAEMDHFSRHEVGQIKSFISTKTDHYRDSYGRLVNDFPRQCVFAGTINPGSNGYMRDETGARRFWPIEITREIDLETIYERRDQLWAEAVLRYDMGETWWLEDGHLRVAAEAIQAERFEVDVWDEIILKWATTRQEISINDVLKFALGIDDVSRWGRAEQMKVGRCLKAAGWHRKRVLRDGMQVYRFFPPYEQRSLFDADGAQSSANAL